MMKILSQTAYLRLRGLNPADDTPAVREAKKAYRQYYQKEYRRLRKLETFRVEIGLNKRQFARLEKESRRHKLPISKLIPVLVFAYLDEVCVYPDTQLLREVLTEIRRIGNNVNQTALKVNLHRKVFRSDIDKMQAQLNDLEQRMAELFNRPQKLGGIIRTILKEKPKYLEQLKSLIREFEQS